MHCADVDNKPCFAMMNGHYLRYSLEYYLRSMDHFGFRYIDIIGLMPHLYVLDMDDAKIEEVRSLLIKYCLQMVSYTPGQIAAQLGLSMNEPNARRRSIEMIKRCVKIAHKLGVPSILVTAGFGYNDSSPELRWGLFCDSVQELASYASNYNIDLLLEPLPSNSSNVLTTSRGADRLIRECGLNNVKCVLDITTMIMQNETIETYFGNLGDNITYVHLSDGPGMHLYPGNGSYDMDGFLDGLYKYGYNGFVAIEIKDPSCLDNPDLGTEQSKRWLEQRGLWLQHE